MPGRTCSCSKTLGITVWSGCNLCLLVRKFANPAVQASSRPGMRPQSPTERAEMSSRAQAPAKRSSKLRNRAALPKATRTCSSTQLQQEVTRCLAPSPTMGRGASLSANQSLALASRQRAKARRRSVDVLLHSASLEIAPARTSQVQSAVLPSQSATSSQSCHALGHFILTSTAPACHRSARRQHIVAHLLATFVATGWQKPLALAASVVGHIVSMDLWISSVLRMQVGRRRQ